MPARPETKTPTTTEVVRVVGQVLLATVPRWLAAWKPKRRQTLSAWARKNARLIDGSRYRGWPCQDDLADAFTDPEVRQISVMKSARVGYSQIVQNYVGYCIDQRPTRLLIYQPTIDDAETYAKDDLAPVLTWPAVRKVAQFKARDPKNQIRAKRFPGGSIWIKGANSEKEFRRVTADKVVLEEPDGYPPASTTKGGDQVARAFMRCLTSDDPLKVAGGTPLVEGSSKTKRLFLSGTQEYRYWPCPKCGHMQRLVFGDGTGPGLRWEPKDNPTRAWYRCAGPDECDIEEQHKPEMDAAGEWRATAPENFPHRSFHLWAAYSQFEGAAWLQIAKEWLLAKKNPALLMTFVNEWLGETWQVKGEAPTWRRLYDRREDYEPLVVPWGGLVLSAGIDVQKDRLEIFVWAWGADRQSWLIDHCVIDGNPYQAAVWAQASTYIQRSFAHEGGADLKLTRVGVDTGFATAQAEGWARKHPGIVVPVKGASTLRAPVFAWSDVREPGLRGGKRRRGMRLGMVGGHVITLELYGYLNLDGPTEADQAAGFGYPAGYVHLSKLATEEFCKQLVGDQWVEDTGEWKQVHATEALDGWKYARAVLVPLGLDRWRASEWETLALQLGAPPRRAPVAADQDDVEDAPVAAALPPAPPPSRVIRSSFVGRVRR